MFVLPANGKRFVYLYVLTSLYTAAAQNALIGVVTIKGIRIINRDTACAETGASDAQC